MTTNRCFYLVELSYEHEFIIGAVKEIKGEINLFVTAGYQTQLLLVSEKLKKISIVLVK